MGGYEVMSEMYWGTRVGVAVRKWGLTSSYNICMSICMHVWVIFSSKQK